jgi:hypothetical protein
LWVGGRFATADEAHYSTDNVSSLLAPAGRVC